MNEMTKQQVRHTVSKAGMVARSNYFEGGDSPTTQIYNLEKKIDYISVSKLRYKKKIE